MGPPGRGLPACAAPKIPSRIIGVLIHAAPPPVGIVNRPVLSSAGERVISNSRERRHHTSRSCPSGGLLGVRDGPSVATRTVHAKLLQQTASRTCGTVIELVSRAALFTADLRLYVSRIQPASGQAT
jgi:hypothetical protein